MTTNETCPHCGAERHLKYADMYECGTSNYSPFDTQSGVCHRREAVQMEREACAVIADGWAEGKQIAAEIRARGEMK